MAAFVSTNLPWILLCPRQMKEFPSNFLGQTPKVWGWGMNPCTDDALHKNKTQNDEPEPFSRD